jgi:hypothetical protein
LDDYERESQNKKKHMAFMETNNVQLVIIMKILNKTEEELKMKEYDLSREDRDTFLTQIGIVKRDYD